jgi:hypothetical protein
MRSTKPPIGIAKNSQGNMLSAAMVEIQNGSLVRVVASSGAAVLSRPSARLLAALAVQSRWNAGLNFVCVDSVKVLPNPLKSRVSLATLGFWAGADLLPDKHR